jgi:predicted DNA-binding protein with PD1-like motif
MLDSGIFCKKEISEFFLFEIIWKMNIITIIRKDILVWKIISNNKIKHILVMKITKQNETFNLVDVTEVFETSGSITLDITGNIHIHFNVRRSDGDHIGDCHYSKYEEVNTANFSINCSEENREELTGYADVLIDSVLNHFKDVE